MATSTPTEVKLTATGKIRFKANGRYDDRFKKLIMDVPEGIACFKLDKETGEVISTERTSYEVSRFNLNRQLQDIVPGYGKKLDEYKFIADDKLRAEKYNNLFGLLTEGIEFEIIATPYHAGDVYKDEDGNEGVYKYDGYIYTVVNGNFPEALLNRLAPMSYEDRLNFI